MAADYPDGGLVQQVGDFLEELARLEIEKLDEVPMLTIPGWPKEAEVSVNLGKRTYLFPALAGDSGLLQYERRTHPISFQISRTGAITAQIEHGRIDRTVKSYTSNKSWNAGERKVCLVLFQQFADELLPAVIRMLKAGLGGHNRVVGDVRAAVEAMRSLGFAGEE